MLNFLFITEAAFAVIVIVDQGFELSEFLLLVVDSVDALLDEKGLVQPLLLVSNNFIFIMDLFDEVVVLVFQHNV